MRKAADHLLTGHAHHLNGVLHSHYPRRGEGSFRPNFRHGVWKHGYGRQSECRTKAGDASPHHDID